MDTFATLQELAGKMLSAMMACDRAYDSYFEDCRFTGVPVFSPENSLAFMIYQAAIERENEARAAFNAYAVQHGYEEYMVADQRP